MHWVPAGTFANVKVCAVGEVEGLAAVPQFTVEAERVARRVAAVLTGARDRLGDVEAAGQLLDRFVTVTETGVASTLDHHVLGG